jgi:hypothetical protein
VCSEVFSSADVLGQHLRDRNCECQPEAKADGLDQEQIAAIRSKKRSRAESDPEKWTKIYKIIFPGEVDIPSPCK